MNNLRMFFSQTNSHVCNRYSVFRRHIVATSTILTLFFCVSCGNQKQTSCKETFQEHYEVNIKALMATMPDLSPETARKRGDCMLNKLYEVDSTFVFMKGEELDRFIKDNLHLIKECNSIE